MMAFKSKMCYIPIRALTLTTAALALAGAGASASSFSSSPSCLIGGVFANTNDDDDGLSEQGRSTRAVAIAQCAARAPADGEAAGVAAALESGSALTRDETEMLSVAVNSAYAAMHNYTYALFVPQSSFDAALPSWCAPPAVYAAGVGAAAAATAAKAASETHAIPEAVLFVGTDAFIVTDSPLDFRNLAGRARAVALARGARPDMQSEWEARTHSHTRTISHMRNVEMHSRLQIILRSGRAWARGARHRRP